MSNGNNQPLPPAEPTKEPIHRFRIWYSDSTFLDIEAADEPSARVRGYLLAPYGVVVTLAELLPN